jgi:hypothetical protein
VFGPTNDIWIWLVWFMGAAFYPEQIPVSVAENLSIDFFCSGRSDVLCDCDVSVSLSLFKLTTPNCGVTSVS